MAPKAASQVELLPRERVKVLSYGGGLDSFAMLLLAIQRRELPDLVIFADVADRNREAPGEWNGTYDHVTQIVLPLCVKVGIEFKWLHTDESPIRGQKSLFDYFVKTGSMPSRQSRLCTSAAKVERISKYLYERYGSRGLGVEVWIGFGKGEELRAERDPHALRDGADGWRVNRFPLMEGEGFCRCREEALVRASGYPVPRKSSCVFCPSASRGDWQTLLRELPGRFAQVEQLEENCKRTKAGKVMRYGYLRGDGTDPALREWIKRPYKPMKMPCGVCGAEQRATKATACGWLTDGEPAVVAA